MTSKNKMIRATYLLGLIPLVVGLSIFFSWWIAKAWFLVTLHRLEGYGFIWILVSIPIGIAGLITAIVYLVQSSKENLIKGIAGLLCVLVNIPALIWVIEKQNDIEQRAYVRILNKSDIDFDELTIKNLSSKGEYKSLSNNDDKTEYFYPKYLNGDFDSVPLVDSVRLVIKTQNDTKTIDVPEIYKGECIRIVVDKEFDIKTK
jgi:hypothetical protein